MIVVRRPGPLTTIQDLGRPGYAHLGVPHAGAADVASLRLANRLVGNDEGAAALEITLVGPELHFLSPTFVAVTGGHVDAVANGRPVAMNAAFRVPADGVLSIGSVQTGVRTYLGVRGGVDVPPVLGSRSTDTLSGLGPPKLAHGQELPLGPAGPAQPWETVVPTPPIETEPVLRVALGPRDNHFDTTAVEVLCQTRWTVTVRSDRSGVRLEGPPLRWRGQRELESEGMVTGAIQVPSDGQPIVFLANHPTTGGYPVIAVVVSADLPLAVQARPGTPLHFRTADAAIPSDGAPPPLGR